MWNEQIDTLIRLCKEEGLPRSETRSFLDNMEVVACIIELRDLYNVAEEEEMFRGICEIAHEFHEGDLKKKKYIESLKEYKRGKNVRT